MTIELDDQQTAITIAALRMGVQHAEEDIASNGGEFDPLGDDAIDVIIDKLQVAP